MSELSAPFQPHSSNSKQAARNISESGENVQGCQLIYRYIQDHPKTHDDQLIEAGKAFGMSGNSPRARRVALLRAKLIRPDGVYTYQKLMKGKTRTFTKTCYSVCAPFSLDALKNSDGSRPTKAKPWDNLPESEKGFAQVSYAFFKVFAKKKPPPEGVAFLLQHNPKLVSESTSRSPGEDLAAKLEEEETRR